MAAEPKNQASQKTAKQLAAQARAESEAQERRRERLIRIIGIVAVTVVVGGLLAIGFFAGRGNSGDDAAFPPPQPDPNAALPQGVTNDTYGVKYGAGWTSAEEAKLPTLEIWEDFQCPICKTIEDASGAQLQELADQGRVKLMYRPAIFLDENPVVRPDNIANGNPNSSARATSAWGCAIDQGKAGEYHSAIFAAQPADEGVGYSDQTLIDLGTQVGVADQAAFTTCVQQGTYLGWAANSNQAFSESGAKGTPAAYLNGVELDNAQLADIATMEKLIADATAQ
jgi:protein-disulfide isomerase